MLLVFSVFSYTAKGPVKIGIVRNISTVLLFPIEKTISFVSNLFTLHRQNTELRKGIAEVSLQIQRCANIREENAILRRLYGFKPLSEFSLIPCEIIGKSPSLHNRSIILDRGTKAGIRKNLPVIAADGLVGKIIETSAVSSEMLTLFNRSTPISGMDLRSRVQGIVKWKGGSYLAFDDVPLHSDVIAGDTIITSGMGGVYPKGIFVAIVQSVSESPKEIVMSIKVKPFVDISLLEDVFVIEEVRSGDAPGKTDGEVKPKAHLDLYETIEDPRNFGKRIFEKEGKPPVEERSPGFRKLTVE